MIMTENIPVFSGFFQLIDEILEHLEETVSGFQFSVVSSRNQGSRRLQPAPANM